MSSTSTKITGVDEVVKNLQNAMVQLEKAGGTAVQITAAQIVVYAKQNAPWRDRTGNARRSIHSEASADLMSSSIGIGMSYGKYLELSFGGRYRIVDPAVFSYGKAMFANNLKGIM